MQSVGMNMTRNITAPIVAAGVAMFKTFADFQDVMAEIEVRSGATAAGMEKLKDVAIELGRDTVFSATEVGEAMLQLTASGSSVIETIEQIPHVLSLAAAGNIDLGKAADGVTDVLKQFNLTAEDALMVANNLAAAAGSSSATVSDLLQGFGNVGPVADQFGLSVNETAAALAIFSENGIKGAEAGTQLKSMLLNMTRDTKKVQNTWVELGVSMFDSAGNMRAIDDIFKDINKAMEGLPMEDQIRIARNLGGSYGIMGFNALRASNGIEEMQAAMSGQATAAEIADARMNTLSGRFKSFMGSLETLAIVLGGLGEGPLTSFLEMATNVINSITKWAQENPKLAQTIMLVVAALAALGPILMIIGSIASGVSAVAGMFSGLAGILGGVMTVGTAVAGAFTTLGGILITFAAPILIAIAAIAALIAIIAILWANREKIAEWAQKAWEGMQKFGEAVKVGFEKTVEFTGNGLAAWEGNFKMMGVIAQKSGQSIGESFQKVAHNVIESFKKVAPVMLDIGKAILQGLIDGVKSKIDAFIKLVVDLANKVAESVKSALKIKSPSQVFAGIGENVVAGFNKGISNMGGLGVNVNGTTLGGASNPSLATVGAGGGSGNIFIQNLNVPPGTTRQQVDAIMEEMARRVNRKKKR